MAKIHLVFCQEHENLQYLVNFSTVYRKRKKFTCFCVKIHTNMQYVVDLTNIFK